MMNVKFISVKLKSTFVALENKDPLALYWIVETSELFKGDQLFGVGALATEQAAGLLSPEDYAELKKLIVAGPASALESVDGSLVISDGKIGVNISKATNNLIAVNSDGLFAAIDLQPIEQRLTEIEKQVVGGIHYKGSVPTMEDLPTNPIQGDLYEIEANGSEYCWNGQKWFEYGTSHFTPVAGDGIVVDGNEISVKIATDSHGLQCVDGSMSITLATKDSDGAMSKEDKKFIDSIPYVYVARKYDISGVPVGTLVNYGEKEIRVMVPEGAEFSKQNVGEGGDANTYYMTLRTYAPNNNVVGYKEHIGAQSDAEILTDLKTDEYGRRYQPSWLGVAKLDEATGTWNYYGKNSSAEKFIGFDYRIDWFDAENRLIAADSVRINLSNESCHNELRPYYGSSDISVEVRSMQEDIAEIKETYTWSNL